MPFHASIIPARCSLPDATVVLLGGNPNYVPFIDRPLDVAMKSSAMKM
jgi:hypothetical protein